MSRSMLVEGEPPAEQRARGDLPDRFSHRTGGWRTAHPPTAGETSTVLAPREQPLKRDRISAYRTPTCIQWDATGRERRRTGEWFFASPVPPRRRQFPRQNGIAERNRLPSWELHCEGTVQAA